MPTSKLPSFSKAIIVAIGMLVFTVSSLSLGAGVFSVGFLVLLAVSAIVAPRMGLVIPRSNVVISFSDSVVFLSFLLYGPAAAVAMAAVETYANCYYNKLSGRIRFAPNMIAVNTAAAAIGTGAACSA